MTQTSSKITNELRQNFKDWTKFWTKQVERGIRDKSIRVKAPPAEIALALVLLTQGLNVYLRATGRQKLSWKAIQVSLKSLLGNL